jgi:hypothetical protein
MVRYERQAHRGFRRGSTRSAPVNGMLLVLLGLSAVALMWRTGFLTEALGVSGPHNVMRIDGRIVAVPEPAAGAVRPLSAVAVTTSGAYSFQLTDRAGKPLGYDPCVPIRYVVQTKGAPPEADQLIADAVATIQSATGWSFESLGTTDEPLSLDRPPIQARYGGGWAPVLFAWSDEAAAPALAGEVLGVGGSAVVPAGRGSREFLAAGRVLLDSADISRLLNQPGGYALARAVIIHELAHVVGLGHVDDVHELMAPRTGAMTQLGPGDLEALAMVGQIACDTS